MRFSIRDQGTNSSATTKIKGKKERRGANTTALLLAPHTPKWRIREFHAIYSGGIQGEDAGKSDDDTVKRDIKRVYRVGYGGRRKRNGRNNVFILCAWLNVFRGLLLETRAAATRRGKKVGEGREEENETTGLKCILILRVDLHNCFDYAVFSRTESPSTAEADPPILDFAA